MKSVDEPVFDFLESGLFGSVDSVRFIDRVIIGTLNANFYKVNYSIFFFHITFVKKYYELI